VGRPELEERLRNTAPGLASSLRLAGTGTQAPLWDQLSELNRPVLILVGATDLRFARVGQRMVGALPDAVFSLVPGSGHPAHLEQPELSALIVERFLTTGSPA
jgi:2-succinyl-6-hydroxy-2,4-cyclohexadiene-1-carboxylate synthase